MGIFGLLLMEVELVSSMVFFFTTYSTEQGLANNVVLSILEDKKGNIWFGTYDGLSRYNGESFTTFRIEEGL